MKNAILSVLICVGLSGCGLAHEALQANEDMMVKSKIAECSNRRVENRRKQASETLVSWTATELVSVGICTTIYKPSSTSFDEVMNLARGLEQKTTSIQIPSIAK